jgi:hypothetical protein
VAQRKPQPPTPIRPAVELVDETALQPAAPFAPARKAAPGVPTRTHLMFERQLIRMQFQKGRSAAATGLAADLLDGASSEVTASLLFSHHLQRGFGDDLSDQERAFFAEMTRLLLAGTSQIAAEAIERLKEMVAAGDLPGIDVSDLDVLWRWLTTS